MQIGIMGLSMVGKTTMFNLLTKTASETKVGQKQVNVGVAKVPDQRIDWLAELYNPKKVTYADIKFKDIPGLIPGEYDKKKLNEFFADVREVDAVVMVLRSFREESVPPALDDIDPLREADTLMTELFLADLGHVESLLERYQKNKKKTKEEELQVGILEKCLVGLEEEKLLSQIGLTDEERFLLRGFGLLTLKPLIFAVNVDEENLKDKQFAKKEELGEYAKERGISLLSFCGTVEGEISQMSEEDKELFMAEYGIEESGIDRLAKTVYELMGLFSFFTVGEDEVRAWTIKKGTKAREAAGKIHSDIERGFIKAEVVSYDILRDLGNMKLVKEQGLWRLEGKEYEVCDGDIINFRHNT